jgi:hypothetical protein
MRTFGAEEGHVVRDDVALHLGDDLSPLLGRLRFLLQLLSLGLPAS